MEEGTRTTAARKMSSRERTPATSQSASGITVTSRFHDAGIGHGNRAVMCDWNTRISSLARSIVAPGRRRPMTGMKSPAQ